MFGNTTIALAEEDGDHQTFRDIFTGETVTAEERERRSVFFPVSKIFSHCPVALLFAESAG